MSSKDWNRMATTRNEQLRRNLDHEVHEPSTGERPTIFTEPGVEDLPLPIRKAMAVKLMLETVPVHIYPGELIVGIGFKAGEMPSTDKN